MFSPQGEGLHGSCGGLGLILISSHLTNGSPAKPARHVQIGLWAITEHWALMPHVPGQGSTHLYPMQASWAGQSDCLVHSGLHPWGDNGSPS